MLLSPLPPAPIQTGVCANISPHAIPSDLYRVEMAISGILLAIFTICGIILFYVTKDKYLRLQQRNIFFPFCVMIGVALLLNATFGREVRGRDSFPCTEFMIMNYFPFFLIAGPAAAPIYMYSYKLRREKLAIKAATTRQQQKGRTGRRMATVVKRETFLSQIKDFFFIWKAQMNKIENSAPVSALRGSTLTSSNAPRKTELKSRHSNIVQQNRFMIYISRYFGPHFFIDFALPAVFCFITGFPFFLVAIIRLVTDPLLSNNCVGCDLEIVDYIAFTCCSVLTIATVLTSVYATRNEPDPMGVKREVLLVCFFGSSLVLISWGLAINDPNHIEKNGQFVWESLFTFAGIVICFIMTYVQVGIAFYQRYTKMKVLDFDIEAIFNDERARSALLKHCTNELSSENVLFLLDVRMWMVDWETDSADLIAERAKEIYTIYIDSNAELAINVSFRIRNEINGELALLKEGGKPRKDIFQHADRECVQILLLDSIPRFRKTKLFEEEIVSTGIIDGIARSNSETV